MPNPNTDITPEMLYIPQDRHDVDDEIRRHEVVTGSAKHVTQNTLYSATDEKFFESTVEELPLYMGDDD